MAEPTVSLLAKDAEQRVPLAALGERLSGLRLRDASALEAMRRSLTRHGQLTAIVVFADGEGLEILDGFKRMHAARALGWSELGAKRSDVSQVDAKVQMAARHDGRGLTEIEEAWLVRSLYREDGLSQPEIARRLARHKSWVCRRLLLVEALDPAVQAEVRLGLLAARAAVALSQLPRGIQRAASAIVVRQGLTVKQSELLVAEILERPDDAARAQWIARRLESAPATTSGGPTRAGRSEADWMAADIATLMRVAARLQARLLGTPLGALGDSAAEIVLGGLGALGPVLAALGHTLGTVTGKERAA
jgi:ParB-like chromosome segregation protein Spo0J